MDKAKGHIDWWILIPVVALMMLGISFVFSASAAIAESKFGSPDDLFLKHASKVLIAIVVLFVCARIDYHFWMKISKPFMFVAITLLILVLSSGKINEVNRWIYLGPFSFQPSEFAKFALILHFAVILTLNQEHIKSFKQTFLPLILWAVLTSCLIALQPNFSTALVIFLIAIIMMFIGNVNIIYLFITLIGGLLATYIYLDVSAGYRLERIQTYFNEQINSISDANYQLNQALIALGNGGIFGIGAGQSRQSHHFLPESYGDFIFSVIGEEYGFVGLGIIILAFIIIFWRGIKIAENAPDLFGYFLSCAILITFAIYVFVNSGVNCGLLPTTGLPMPFISYGGTAIIIYAAAMGVLLNISAQAGMFPFEKKNEEVE